MPSDRGRWARREVASAAVDRRADQGACPHVEVGEPPCAGCFFEERST